VSEAGRAASSDLDRPVLHAPQNRDCGVTAESLRMSRGALLELGTVAQPQSAAAGFDAAHRLSFDIEGSHGRRPRWRIHATLAVQLPRRRCIRSPTTGLDGHERIELGKLARIV